MNKELTQDRDSIRDLFHLVWLLDELDTISLLGKKLPARYSKFDGSEIELGNIFSGESAHLSPQNKKQLKALLFIALYGVLEKHIRAILNEGFSAINHEAPKYSLLTKEIKTVWLKYKHRDLSKPQYKEWVERLEAIPLDIFTIDDVKSEDGFIVSNYDAYSTVVGKNSDVGGNVDYRRVKLLFTELGISIPSTKHPGLLKTLKDKRNSVAHGKESLTEVGKAYSMPDFFRYFEVTFEFLSECYGKAEIFSRSKAFLAT